MTEIKHAIHDDILSGKAEDMRDLTKVMMVFSVGPRFDKAALAACVLSWRALDIKPTTAITFHVMGYDSDPRELWNVPEVCAFIQKFCARTKAHESPAMEPVSRALLLACGADPTKRVSVDIISTEKALKKSGAFFKARIRGEDEL